MLVLSKHLAAFGAGQPSKPLLANTPRSSEHVQGQEVCITSASDISRLQERPRNDRGNDQFPVILMRPVSLAAFALFDGLSRLPQSQEEPCRVCASTSLPPRAMSVPGRLC
ncbi:uncharacterized protein A1O9_07057 [Exophiala aquamarina CBS 119918]|uniref:Uncharacterized protein n=1 Tax=Exophiala aquamarina CBS 119918 TaxID=1182545 RepID=A0A072PAT7_9EURO|nr:uncharacterized protein A1O9_07057 [Exophiala aquamarina CBS 119918]KEF56867.1 hypothetical protein A1O9_07057 [Exophiala aquamarina CBS 119918]